MPDPIASRQPGVRRTMPAQKQVFAARPDADPATSARAKRRGEAARGVKELGTKVPVAGQTARTVTQGEQPAPSPEVRELQSLARSTRAEHPRRVWDPDAPLREGRNAHHSNTVSEMRDALSSDKDYNWLEGDLRVADDGTLVMAHDADKEGSGLTLDAWLQIGGAAQRGMKVDVKEADAIPKLLDALEASGIPDGRIMINVGDVPMEQLREMRERFPQAWIALDPSTTESGYPSSHVDRVIAAADELGGRIAFPIRWDLADQKLIDRLEPHGDVSIWTSRTQGTPNDTEAEIRRLRERGVEGVIDLGPPSSLMERAWQRLNDVWESGPSRGVRNLASTVGNGLVDGFNGAVAVARRAPGAALDAITSAPGAALDVVTSAPGAARKVLSKAPLVGGLFD